MVRTRTQTNFDFIRIDEEQVDCRTYLADKDLLSFDISRDRDMMIGRINFC